ncbi:MAG TPA: hypothetical protein VGQ93_03850 [Lysobacter sp.]|jgi:hypothetical protein|nr:hypothetical protein [Lysobacter sp.]
MPNSQINVTLTVGGTNGNYTYSWSGDNVDSSGNLDFSSYTNPIQATIALSSAMDLQFEGPARDTMLMCPADELPQGQCPTSAYSNGTEFNGFAFPGNDSSNLQFVDNNNDDVDWAYALQIHNNTTNTTFVCDPNIINR